MSDGLRPGRRGALPGTRSILRSAGRVPRGALPPLPAHPHQPAADARDHRRLLPGSLRAVPPAGQSARAAAEGAWPQSGSGGSGACASTAPGSCSPVTSSPGWRWRSAVPPVVSCSSSGVEAGRSRGSNRPPRRRSGPPRRVCGSTSARSRPRPTWTESWTSSSPPTRSSTSTSPSSRCAGCEAGRARAPC